MLIYHVLIKVPRKKQRVRMLRSPARIQTPRRCQCTWGDGQSWMLVRRSQCNSPLCKARGAQSGVAQVPRAAECSLSPEHTSVHTCTPEHSRQAGRFPGIWWKLWGKVHFAKTLRAQLWPCTATGLLLPLTVFQSQPPSASLLSTLTFSSIRRRVTDDPSLL